MLASCTVRGVHSTNCEYILVHTLRTMAGTFICTWLHVLCQSLCPNSKSHHPLSSGVLGSSGGSHLSVGEIIAIVVAVILGFLFILFCCSWWAKRRYRNRQYTHLHSPGTAVHVHTNVRGTSCGAMQVNKC